MAESTYFLPADDEAVDILKRVCVGYDRFKHISPDQITLIFKVCIKNRFIAETRKIPSLYRTFIPGKDFIITLFRPTWEPMNLPQKVAVMYHELVHIGWDNEKAEYKMVRHDVEDFKELIEKLGFNYENALDLFKEMKTPVEAPACATESA